MENRDNGLSAQSADYQNEDQENNLETRQETTGGFAENDDLGITPKYDAALSEASGGSGLDDDGEDGGSIQQDGDLDDNDEEDNDNDIDLGNGMGSGGGTGSKTGLDEGKSNWGRQENSNSGDSTDGMGSL